jgi:crotonobetainyl-CoA:carnitine CoA-transferase CaiB-like acyl-CoA transferase
MLAGIRVLDLSDERGFLAGKILGDLGADVVKIEPPGGDAVRRRGPYLGGVEDPERSLPFLALNTSKRGITLELGSPRGREIFGRLLDKADAVLETAPPGAMDGDGIGWKAQAALHPRLVWCSLTPFGQSGPYSAWSGHDLVIVALGGNPSATGDPDRPPLRCSMPTSMIHACPEAALGIAMGLYARTRTGRGQHVDVSMHECQLQALLSFPGQVAAGLKLPTRPGPRIGRTREIWPTQDGYITFGLRGGKPRIENLIAMVAYMDECGQAPTWMKSYEWQSYNHNLLTDAEIARLEEGFGAFFRTKSMRELYTHALARKILLAPCNDAKEIFEHRQLRDRGLFTTVEYPELGAKIEQPAFFAKSSEHPIGIRRRAPRIGEHNEAIFAEIGIDEAELARLSAQGVI